MLNWLTSPQGLAGWWPGRRACAPPVATCAVDADESDAAACDVDGDQLIDAMLRDHRFALLLRPQIAANLNTEQYDRAVAELQRHSALVPAGNVILQAWSTAALADENEPALEHPLAVEAVYLDRDPVTNRQFEAFVRSGAYEQSQLWDEAIWPRVSEFVDRSGQPGPRFWDCGRSPPERAEHPVVGVNWFEASAYARWVGKRLPTDAEWVKAGAWPVVAAGGTRLMQRRFPWGDTLDRHRANLWGSGPCRTVPVHEFADGASLGGVRQLIGNVWEWTATDFGIWDAPQRRLETAAPMKSLRGGAFDTYFERQATCQFHSGDTTLARKHNIGFRCAIGVCDLQLPDEPAAEGSA